jgi:hypothetical protein
VVNVGSSNEMLCVGQAEFEKGSFSLVAGLTNWNHTTAKQGQQ